MMQRKRIGVVFSNNENWIGGTYYLLNLVSSFLSLEDKDRPEVCVVSWHEKDYEIVKKTGYPYVSFLSFYIPYTRFQIILNKFFPNYVKNHIKQYYKPNQLDVIFPFDFQQKLEKINNKVFWIPDFQEYFLPEFFSKEEITHRQNIQQKIANQKSTLVLSSYAAKHDFENIYPTAICPIKVVNFAVSHPPYNHLEIAALKQKFNITQSYFFAPNQFWKHKNHITVIKAVKLLKEQGVNVLVVFTGKETDYRNPTYTDDLKKYVKENYLDKHILFLGFIDRDEQLQLMNHAIAVIQPSLFEGWSTVVEDAKAMSQYVIASNLDVHKEQLVKNACFFEPKDEMALAKILANIVQSTELSKQKIDYQKNVKNFAESFLQLVK